VKYRFLIDANVTLKLTEVAWARGHEAYHVRDLKRERQGDPVLLKLIEDEGYTLVTNNVVEFRNRYRNRRILHAGVVFIVEASRGRGYQIEAFTKALDYIEAHDPIDDTELVVEPDTDGGYKVSAAPLP
jgi:hypothetical protein